MEQDITPNAKLARGEITLGIRRLAGRYPFHAKTLEQFRLECRPGIPTMGVSFSGGNLRLSFNPGFVCEVSADELLGVLLHEVHHVVFGHVLADRSADRDSWARVVAEEITVNEFVTEPLPGAPITLAMFPDFPVMESTGARYQRLIEWSERFEWLDYWEWKSRGMLDEATRGMSGGTACVVDDRSGWGDCDQPGIGSARAALKALLHDASIAVGAGRVPHYLHPALRRLGVQFGSKAGCGTLTLDGNETGHLNWRALLRRFVGRHAAATSVADFRRRPRRVPDLIGVIPGRRRSGRLHVLAAVDTSASVSKQNLEAINGELVRLSWNCRVTVVECDAAIQRTYRYRKIQSVSGRGGTDFRPVFDQSFLTKHRPDIVVFFTDGFGPAPATTPALPVLWCLTPHGRKPVKWGEVAWMTDDVPAIDPSLPVPDST